MVVLFIDEKPYAESSHCIEGTQQMILEGWNGAVDNHKAKILDVAENRIKQKKILDHR